MKPLLLLACGAFLVCGWAPPVASARVDLRGSPTSRSHFYLVARVRPGISVAVRSSPFGRVLAHLGDRTPFGSQRTFSVVRRRGRWLQVTEPTLTPGRLGWINAQPGRVVRYATTALEIEVDLSSRTLVLRRNTHVLRRMLVDIGSAQSPTPTGRFAITDKLDGAAYSPVYGCCILALSTRQTHLPTWWRGGDRLAIHATNSEGLGFGHALTAGCVRAANSNIHYLMQRVPLGAPVVIHH
jgi:hypothetical protein